MPLVDFLNDSSHRRWNPLLEEWVLVSPHRSKRPWQGAIEKSSAAQLPQYIADCYLCPGNLRANGVRNPSYSDILIFDNDFSALSAAGDQAGKVQSLDGIISAQQESGICRVICFSPRHDQTLPDLEILQIKAVIDAWAAQYEELSTRPDIAHVMTFENKGAIMGCSNPHPHGQIWATSYIPNLALRIADSQKRFFADHKDHLLLRYANWELEQKVRLVGQNEHFIAVVPFWAVWPFEVMILPLRNVSTISELNEMERVSWAKIIQEVTKKFDALFQCSFPYSMGVYQKPCEDGEEWKGFTLHQVFLPPLLRSATVKKFMVGFELCGEPQRDITPEEAAKRLRG